MNNNTIETKSIGALLDGKNFFYVPSYQRGYRWTHKQVDDLLDDLYSFKKRASGNFYCLQPVIVREIEDVGLRTEVMGTAANDESIKLWELVDGQQRLTTIFVLLKYLINKERMSEEQFQEDYNAALYRMFYESRPSCSPLLQKLGEETAEERRANIDAVHITNAYHYIDQWFSAEGHGAKLSKLLVGGEGEVPRKMRQAILDLLTSNESQETVKVIWYQLENDESKDPIQEFIRINNGKIPLTDTELVKALFLQERIFGGESNRQTMMSMQWEEMENTLQVNDFWCFISQQGVDAEDRMGELLKLVYLKNNEAKESDMEPGDVFRYYYEKIETLGQSDLKKTVGDMWTEIIDTFHTLQDWYEAPEIYNYVGFLVQSGRSLTDIYLKFEENRQSVPFLDILRKEIKHTMKDIKVDIVDDGRPVIRTEYGDRPKVRKTLLLMNVELLSSQLLQIRKENKDAQSSDAKVFRFPFDLYKSQNWDIEHIDSATTNTLTAKNDKKDWVTCAIKDIWKDSELPEEIRELLKNKDWDNLMGLIKRDQGEDDNEDNKNFIGNLTLLDSSTNREYHNALFCRKRMFIINKAMKGRYILPCTQYVFMKFFDNSISSADRAKWTAADKQKYHDYMVQILADYLPNIPQKKDNDGE